MGLPWHNTQRGILALPFHQSSSCSWNLLPFKRRVKFLLDIHQPPHCEIRIPPYITKPCQKNVSETELTCPQFVVPILCWCC